MIENLKELVPYNVLIGDDTCIDTHLVEVNEEWKEIQGYEGYYAISNFGRYKGLRRNVDCGRKGIRRYQEKLLKIFKDKDGYGFIMPCKNGINTTLKLHRAVATLFLPNPLNKPQVNHKKGDKFDNRFFMIEWATESENRLHAYKTGLQKPTVYGGWNNGEKSGVATFRDVDVIKIREMKGTMMQKDIAKIYNTSPQQISAIIKRKIWKNI